MRCLRKANFYFFTIFADLAYMLDYFCVIHDTIKDSDEARPDIVKMGKNPSRASRDGIR